DSEPPPFELAGTRKELETLLADRRYEEALELLFAARRANPQAEEISRGIQLLKQRLIRRYLRVIGNLDHVPQPSVTREALDARATSEDEREVMHLIDGISTYGDIVRGSRRGRYETFALLARLVAADVVTATGQRNPDDEDDGELSDADMEL